MTDGAVGHAQVVRSVSGPETDFVDRKDAEQRAGTGGPSPAGSAQRNAVDASDPGHDLGHMIDADAATLIPLRPCGSASRRGERCLRKVSAVHDGPTPALGISKVRKQPSPAQSMI